MVVLVISTCAGPVLAADSDSSDTSSSDSSSSDSVDDSPDSSDDSVDDSPDSSDDSVDDSPDSSGDSVDDSPDSVDDSVDGSPDSSDDSVDGSPDSSDDSVDDSPDSSDDSVDDSPDSSDDSRSGQDLSDEIRSIRESTDEREIELERELSQYSGEQLAQMSDDKNLRIAVYTIQQAGAISGAGIAAPQLASIADEINRLADDSLQQEDRIRERSDVVRFFVGGDRDAAASLDRDADSLQIHITQLEQLLASKDLDNEIKPVLQDQLQVLVQERDHIRETASREREDTGLLGGIFGS